MSTIIYFLLLSNNEVRKYVSVYRCGSISITNIYYLHQSVPNLTGLSSLLLIASSGLSYLVTGNTFQLSIVVNISVIDKKGDQAASNPLMWWMGLKTLSRSYADQSIRHWSMVFVSIQPTLAELTSSVSLAYEANFLI